MKRIYEKYIKISDDRKIAENVFKSRIILSVITILSSVTVMVSTAFAFFNSNLTKDFTMHAAVWDIDVVETISQERISSSYKCIRTPEEGEMYEFTISPRGTATEGYCEIIITSPDGKTDKYYINTFADQITVSIQAVAGCEIQFIPKWGIPDNYGSAILCNESIFHSFTQPSSDETPAEDGEASDSSSETDSEETESGREFGASDETSSGENETSSDKAESSDDENELSGSGESLKENTGDSSEETSSPDSDESSSSPESGQMGSSSSSDSSAPDSNSSSSNSPASDSSSSSSDSSAPGGSSSSSDSSAPGGSSSVNSNPESGSSSSSGGESSSSGTDSGVSDGGGE